VPPTCSAAIPRRCRERVESSEGGHSRRFRNLEDQVSALIPPLRDRAGIARPLSDKLAAFKTPRKIILLAEMPKGATGASTWRKNSGWRERHVLRSGLTERAGLQRRGPARER
jgi:hypothetical protein